VWLWTSLVQPTFTYGLIWLGVGVVILLVITRFFTRKPPVMDLAESDDLKVAAE